MEVLTSRVGRGGASKAQHPGWVAEVTKLRRRGAGRDVRLEQNQRPGWATGRRSRATGWSHRARMEDAGRRTGSAVGAGWGMKEGGSDSVPGKFQNLGERGTSRRALQREEKWKMGGGAGSLHRI